MTDVRVKKSITISLAIYSVIISKQIIFKLIVKVVLNVISS